MAALNAMLKTQGSRKVEEEAKERNLIQLGGSQAGISLNKALNKVCKILIFVCLQKDPKQCCGVTKAGLFVFIFLDLIGYTMTTIEPL